MSMESEYKNNFGEAVINNSVLMNKLTKAVTNMKNADHLFISTEQYQAYLYQDKDNKCHYLAFDDGTLTTIYREDHFEKKPFQRLIDGDSDSLKYYASFVISVFNSKAAYQKAEDKILKMLAIYPDDMKASVRENLIRNDRFPTQASISNPYLFKMLLEFFEKNNLASSFDKDFLYQNPGLYAKIQERVAEFGIVLTATKEALKKHNLIEKNQIVYNDLDNRFWKSGQYIISTEQNFAWVMDIKDAQNFTVYASLSPHNGHGSKAKSASGLLKKVKSGETLDDLDYVGLRVENGKVQYANNAFIYSLDYNILDNGNRLEDEGLLIVDYGDVDTKSFEYQFAYVNKEYGHSKIFFLIHSLLILGNGYSYDKEQGRLFSDVKYIPGLLENFNYQEREEDKAPLTSLIYVAPQKLKYLDDQWLANLKYLVDKIKQDKPDLRETHTGIEQNTPEEALLELDKVIQYNEYLRKNAPKL